MVPFLYTPREHHNVGSADEYRRRHADVIAERQRRGARYQVHEVETPIVARVDANTWLVDCPCGAGNATDPEWRLACCFGCGAVHTHVVFPDPAARTAIEAVLVARPRPIDRAWHPRERVADLVQENRDIRAHVPQAVTAFLQAGGQ